VSAFRLRHEKETIAKRAQNQGIMVNPTTWKGSSSPARSKWTQGVKLLKPQVRNTSPGRPSVASMSPLRPKMNISPGRPRVMSPGRPMKHELPEKLASKIA